jgi:hypothetical protein
MRHGRIDHAEQERYGFGEYNYISTKSSGQLIEQRFSIPEVRLIEALGEPLVDRR